MTSVTLAGRPEYLQVTAQMGKCRGSVLLDDVSLVLSAAAGG